MVFSHAATAGRGLASDAKYRATGLDGLSALALVRSVRDYCRRRRDYRHLAELPDYLLDDIGLTRTEVRAARRRLF